MSWPKKGRRSEEMRRYYNKILLYIILINTIILLDSTYLSIFMDLKLKSKENIEILKYSIQKQKYYNATGGRAYYAAFQSIKHYLISKNYDYIGFLQREGIDDRPFSHGTIKHALIDYLVSIGINLFELKFINFLDNLYWIRRKADYETDGITEKNLMRCLENANNIISIVDKY